MYYISDVCRACLQNEQPLIDIVKKETEPDTLINKLKLCVSEVEWTDSETIYMCQLCIEKLDSSYEFKRKCLRSVELWQKYILHLRGSEEQTLLSKLYIEASRNEVGKEFIDEYVKIKKAEEESKQAATSILVKPNQQLYPALPNLILATNGNNNNSAGTFQNIFLNLIPSNAIKYQPTNLTFVNRFNQLDVTKHPPLLTSVPPPLPIPVSSPLQIPQPSITDANQNMFLNINNTLHKIYPIITPNNEQHIPHVPIKPPDDVNISRILTESNTEELSVEIDPMCFECIPEEDSKNPEENSDVKDWEDLISSNKICPSTLNKSAPDQKVVTTDLALPALTKLSGLANNYLPPQQPITQGNKDFQVNFEKSIIKSSKKNYVPIRPKNTNNYAPTELEENVMDYFNVDHFMVPKEQVDRSSIESQDKSVMCEECGQMCDTLKTLRCHIKQFHLGKFPYKCKFCSSPFALRTQYDAHMHIHTMESFSKDTITLEDLSHQKDNSLFPLVVTGNNGLKADMETSEIVDNGGGSLENYFKCETCPRRFTSMQSLTRHKNRKHNQPVRRKYFVKGMKNAKCDICNREFSTQSYLQLHIKLHYRRNDYRLKVFNIDKYESESKEKEVESAEQQSTSEEKTNKTTNKNEEEMEEMPVQEENSNKTENAEPEMPEVTQSQGLKIKINLKNIKQQAEMVAEMNEDNVESMQEEDSKSEEATSELDQSTNESVTNGFGSENAIINMECKEDQEKFPADIEENEAFKDETLPDNQHFPIKVSMVDGKQQCTFCLKLYTRKHDLKRHLNNIHLKAIQYMCHLCKSQFYEAFHLTRHLRQHNGFVRCGTCLKDFSVLRDLKLHINAVHENVAPCHCGSCGQSFQRIKHLRDHMYEHDKSIIYKCHICNMEFRESRTLSKHLVEHSGMYSCSICQTTFAAEHELNNHIKYHNENRETEPRYECEVCRSKFKKKRYLLTHMKKSHLDREVRETFNCRMESDCESS